MRVVQKVISAGADDKANALSDVNVLVQGRIDVEVAGAKQGVAADVAESWFRCPLGQEHGLDRQGRGAVDGGVAAMFGNVVTR